MSQGFGATYGSGSTDIIQTGYITHGLLRSYGLWTYRNGDGGGPSGRMFDKTDSVMEMLYNNSAGYYEYWRGWSGAIAVWRITRPATGSWVHVLLTYDANSTSNNPVIYLDGVTQTVSEVTAPSGTINNNSDDYDIGNRSSDSGRNWDGMLAEWAVWDAILTADEASALGKGAHALSIRPASLVNYRPMVRDFQDLLRANTGGELVVQPHPRVFRSPRLRLIYPGAAASGGQPPRSLHQFRLRRAA